jgi:hypothetical protein
MRDEWPAMSLHFRFETVSLSSAVPKDEKREDAVLRALELELTQKRLRWEREREKYRTLRVLSIAFLLLVILAALVGFFFFFTRAKDAVDQHPAPSATLSPH